MNTETTTASGGYILLARRIKFSEIYLKKPVEWRAIWIHILLSVNWDKDKPQAGLDKGEGFFCFTLNCAWLNGVSAQTWKRCIKYLKEHKDIVTEQLPRGMKITVTNYSHYQDPNSYTSQDTPNTPADNQPSPAPRKGPDTWLTGINDVWRKHMGGDIHFKSAAKALAKVYKEHSEPEFLAALDAYLADAGKLASIPRFASTIGQWLPKKPANTYHTGDKLVQRIT